MFSKRTIAIAGPWMLVGVAAGVAADFDQRGELSPPQGADKIITAIGSTLATGPASAPDYVTNNVTGEEHRLVPPMEVGTLTKSSPS